MLLAVVTAPSSPEYAAIDMTSPSNAAAPAPAPAVSPIARATPPAPTGQPGDFDFLTGAWKIRNRRRKDAGTTEEWEQFEGEATVTRILAGAGSVEDLRIPSRGFAGMGLRLLDMSTRLWADHWVNAKSGVLAPPPIWGSFVAGVGTWDSDEEAGDAPVIVRGVWDRITPRSCRWFQAISRDGGARWQENWVMEWTRA